MKSISILFFLAFSAIINAETITPESDEILKLHVIQSKKIKTIMEKLSLSLYEEKLTMKQINALFDNASELLIAAKNMNQALPGIELTVAEKSIFENVAKQLQIEANNLGYMAQHNDKEGIEISYRRLQDTCVACHELFRF
jgi:cytochrome c556